MDAFVERVGVPELNAAADEFKNGSMDRFMAHRLDLALVAEECDVDDHRRVDCDHPHGDEERYLCEIAREGPSAFGARTKWREPVPRDRTRPEHCPESIPRVSRESRMWLD